MTDAQKSARYWTKTPAGGKAVSLKLTTKEHGINVGSAFAPFRISAIIQMNGDFFYLHNFVRWNHERPFCKDMRLVLHVRARLHKTNLLA